MATDENCHSLSFSKIKFGGPDYKVYLEPKKIFSKILQEGSTFPPIKLVFFIFIIKTSGMA